jgi:hypothetical protein
MAAIIAGVNYSNTANNTAHATASFTPAAGDLLVVMVAASGRQDTPTITTSLAGESFTHATSAVLSTNTSSTHIFVANQLTTATARTITATFGGATTGGYIQVYRISGMEQVGLEAIRQVAKRDSGAQNTAPTGAVFPGAALTTNPVVGLWQSTGTLPTLPTGFTVDSNVTYSTPTMRHASIKSDSGFASTDLYWGSTSATVYSFVALELDSAEVATGPLETVGSTLEQSYAILATVGSDLAQSYGIAAQVGSTLAQSYAVLSPVGANLDQSYGIANAVGSTLAQSYSVLAPVGSTLSQSYAIEGAAPIAGVVASATSAAALSTLAGTVARTGTVAGAASAGSASTPAGTVSRTGVVAGASSASAASTPAGTAIRAGAVAGASAATAASTPTATVNRTGAVSGAVTGTTASTPAGSAGVAPVNGVVASAVSAVTASAVAGSVVRGGTVSAANSAAASSSPSGNAVRTGSVGPNSSSAALSTPTGTKTVGGAISLLGSSSQCDSVTGNVSRSGTVSGGVSAALIQAIQGSVLNGGNGLVTLEMVASGLMRRGVRGLGQATLDIQGSGQLVPVYELSLKELRLTVQALTLKVQAMASVLTATAYADLLTCLAKSGLFLHYAEPVDLVKTDDWFRMQFGRHLSDALSIVDFMGVLLAKPLQDTVVSADARTIFIGKQLVDSAVALEAAVLALSRTISDSVALSDTLSRTIEKTLSSTADATDEFNSQAVADDGQVSVVGKTVTESIFPTDSASVSMTRGSILDSTATTDVLMLTRLDYADASYFAENYVGTTFTY